MRHCLSLLMLVSCLATTPLYAQTAGDPVSGRRIAQQWCTSCHSLSPASSNDTVPSFPDIARNPMKTEDYLRNWLTRPHPPMPDFNLSRDDINDIIAFLHTLKN